MYSPHTDSSLGELFSDLTRQMSRLVRQEIALASTEMSHKAYTAGRAIGLLVGGGLVLYGAFLALIAGMILLVAQVIAAWLAAFVVGLLVAGGGYLLLQSGRESLKGLDPAPRHTMDTLKEDVTWAKAQV
jgi:hypothetical protein